jgi:RHS repeat-associated protein
VQQYDNATNSQIMQSRSYLSNGNVWAEFDANGNASVTCYDSNSLYPVTRLAGAMNVNTGTAYSASVCSSGYPEARTTAYNYDGLNGGGSGVLVSVTDSDNKLGTSFTYDNLGRVKTQIQSGPAASRNTSTVYDDVALKVTTTQDDITNQPLTSVAQYDGLGRLSYTKDGAGDQVSMAYAYGANVSYELQSNPYTAATAASDTDPSMGWTLTTRDLAGRVTNIRNYLGVQNGSAVGPPAPWGSNMTVTGSSSIAYDQTFANCSNPGIAVTDEANNTRQYCPDGLGRLLTVIEPPASAVVTRYRYDNLSNLTSVDVDGQPSTYCTNGSDGTQHMRCFGWSTVSRLMSATNPESGKTSYAYDSNGSLKSRTDAIGNIMTVAAYDHLNRPIGASVGAPAINYSINSPTIVTPAIIYTYDQDFKGAVSSISSPVSSASYIHDDFGRIVSNTQNTNNNSYTFSYTYSNTDFLTSVKYPSGRQVGYTPDAADRLVAVQNVSGGGNYASFTYKASGVVNTMNTGNSVTQQFSWNDRIQPMSLTVTGPGATSLVTLGFYPCVSQAAQCSTGNNGNLQSQTIQMPGLSLNQTYSYDPLNRLTGAQETGTQNGSATSSWNQSFGYDPLGNRWVSQSQTVNTQGTPTNFNLSSQVPLSSNWFANATSCASLPQGQPCPLNQIIQGGWSYDKAGNLLQVGGMLRSFLYDAENRQVSATINNLTSNYVYDGLGQRVSRTANGETVTYVYDAFGNVAAEYSTVSHASPCGTATCYTATDHLGSTRLLTDLSGTVQRRYDYLPFGDDLLAGVTGRGTSMGYESTPDGVNPKFTGQDRDTETLDPSSQSGSDWFNTRYMSSAQGRFQSVDPANAGADLGNPGTWNGYSYVANNPLSYTDPSGMFIEAIGPASSGGPVGTIIGVLIDIGELLGAFFGSGGGGGGHPPAPLPQTSISLTAPGSGASDGSDGWGSQSVPFNPLGPLGIPTGGACSGFAQACQPQPSGPRLPVSGINITALIRYLNCNARSTYGGFCAKYVREALKAAGMNTTGHPIPAKDYGPFLESRGCKRVTPNPDPSYTPQTGDITVLQPVPGMTTADGHIEVFDGTQWISDTLQGAVDLYPGSRYRKAKNSYAVYRCQ